MTIINFFEGVANKVVKNVDEAIKEFGGNVRFGCGLVNAQNGFPVAHINTNDDLNTSKQIDSSKTMC